MQFLNGLIGIQKSDGLVQFTVQLGATNALTLGTKPTATSVQTFSTGPLYAGYITLAPIPDLTISAGRIGSLEGFEQGIDWFNSNVLLTDLFFVENSQSTGVTATYMRGPASVSLTFGDGFDTGVWNFLQASATYNSDSNNALTLFGATNLGRTGLNAHIYGSATLPWSASTVAAYGANYVNSTLVGGFYSYTIGNLNLVPEVQYVYAKADHSLGLPGYSSNFGAALFADYQFGKSPYSLGAWVEYFSSSGPDTWFLSPGAQGVGLSVAPTWQGKYLFVRGDLGLLHLIRIGNPGMAAGYGASSNGRNQLTAVLEAGVLF